MTDRRSVSTGIVVLLFVNFMLATITAMAAPLGNVWNFRYQWAGMWGNMMNFSAYLLMGVPAGKLLKRMGYKRSLVFALGVGVIGVAIQLLSSYFGADIPVLEIHGDLVCLNFLLYLLGAFVCGFCVCILNVVVSPMMYLLAGGGDRGTQFNQFAGAANSLGQTVTPMIVGALIGTVTASTSMLDVAPLLYACLFVLIASIFVISFMEIAEPRQASSERYESSPWHFRHFVLGAIAIFFYTAIEVGIPAELNFYITSITGENGAAAGGAIAAIYWLLMMIGRAVGGILATKFPTRVQLLCTVSVAMVLILVAILIPSGVFVSIPGYSVSGGFSMFRVPLSTLFLVLCGLCTSVMWSCIFGLSVSGLGKYTEEASGIFMMMICGGGVLPLLQDMLAKSFGAINSYWLVFAMLVFLLYYVVWGCRPVDNGIKTD